MQYETLYLLYLRKPLTRHNEIFDKIPSVFSNDTWENMRYLKSDENKIIYFGLLNFYYDGETDSTLKYFISQ